MAELVALTGDNADVEIAVGRDSHQRVAQAETVFAQANERAGIGDGSVQVVIGDGFQVQPSPGSLSRVGCSFGWLGIYDSDDVPGAVPV